MHRNRITPPDGPHLADSFLCDSCHQVLPRKSFRYRRKHNGEYITPIRCRMCQDLQRANLPPVEPPNPSGLCLCGCGASTPIADQTTRAQGVLVGHSFRYIRGHKPNMKSGVLYIVDEQTDCWVWQRALDTKGYGLMWDATARKLRRAHRVFYERVNGDPGIGPNGKMLVLDHLCSNRRCVNPAHLEPVTNAENRHREVVRNHAKRDAA